MLEEDPTIGDTVSDILQQLSSLKEVVARSQNLNNVSVGQTLPPRIQSGMSIPPVSNLRATKGNAILGQTKLTVTWTDPDDISQVGRYNIYLTGNVTGQTQEIQVASSRKSPAIFNILPDLQTSITVYVQTVLRNGQAMDISQCPTTTITSLDPQKVGIGTINPQYTLHIVTPNAAGFVLGEAIQNSTATAGGPELKFYKTRGAPGAETAVLSGDGIGSVGFSGFDGTVALASSRDMAQVVAFATENWTASAHGSRMILRTCPNGSINESDVVFLSQDRNLGLNTNSFSSGAGVVAIANATVAPSLTPGTGGILWAAAGALHWLGTSGTDTIIAPA